VNDALVLVLTALLALGALGWILWGVWRLARRTPTRQQASTHVLGSVAGTTLLGVVLPAASKGAFDAFPVWLVYAALTVAVAALLGWRWPAMPSGKRGQPAVVVTACLTLVVLGLAGVAVT
jgi:hypothetical protein